MGYNKGTPLGKRGRGIVAPIEVEEKHDRYGLDARERFTTMHPQRLRQIERDQRVHQEFVSNRTGEEYLPQRQLDPRRYNLNQEPLSFSDPDEDEESVEEVQINEIRPRDVMNIDEEDYRVRVPSPKPLPKIAFITQADLRLIEETKTKILALIKSEEEEFHAKNEIKHSRVPEEFSRQDSPSRSTSPSRVDVIDLEMDEEPPQEVKILEDNSEERSKEDMRSERRELKRQIDRLLDRKLDPEDSTAMVLRIEEFATKMQRLIRQCKLDDFDFIAESFQQLQELTGSNYIQMRMNLLAFIYCYPIIKQRVIEWDFGLAELQKEYNEFKSTIEDIEFHLVDLKNSMDQLGLDLARKNELKQVYEGFIRRREEVEEDYEIKSQQAYQELREQILTYCDEFSDWKKFLKTQVDFNTHPIWSKIVYGLVINKIKIFVKELWMPQPDSPSNNICLLIVELFQEVLPLEDLNISIIVPKLKRVVSKWDPHTDQTPIVQFLEPWFDILGQNLSENIMVALYKKISPILIDEWQINDPSARVILKTFQRACPALLMRFLRNCVIPKLEMALFEFEITPENQDLDLFWQVISWRDLLSPTQMEDLLIEFFFPKWINVLQIWLEDGSIENKAYEEISHWYSGWKNIFVATELIELPQVLAQFNSALHLMNIALATRLNVAIFFASTLPKDVWGLIIKQLHIYDLLFLRATCSWLHKYCKEYRPFPKFFVLAQDKCMEYLSENGFISLLDYVKSTLHFEWTDFVTSAASRSGQVSTLKYLVENSCPYDKHSILGDCFRGTCDLNMIEYLHELKVRWRQRVIYATFDSLRLYDVMDHMAYHGHVSCMKYAIENGCDQRVIQYTPTTECLDFAIQHGFQWQDSHHICEEAARRGNLTMLKYAHQKGAKLFNSTAVAANQGHLDCLMYAAEHSTAAPRAFVGTKTLECFEHLINKYPELAQDQRSVWMAQLRIGNVDILRHMIKKGLHRPGSTLEMMSALTIDVYKFLVDEMHWHVDQLSAIVAFAQNGIIEGIKLVLASPKNTEAHCKVVVLSDIDMSNYNSNEHYTRLQQIPIDLHEQLLAQAMLSHSIETVKFIWDELNGNDTFNLSDFQSIAINTTPEIAPIF